MNQLYTPTFYYTTCKWEILKIYHSHYIYRTVPVISLSDVWYSIDLGEHVFTQKYNQNGSFIPLFLISHSREENYLENCELLLSPWRKETLWERFNVEYWPSSLMTLMAAKIYFWLEIHPYNKPLRLRLHFQINVSTRSICNSVNTERRVALLT